MHLKGYSNKLPKIGAHYLTHRKVREYNEKKNKKLKTEYRDEYLTNEKEMERRKKNVYHSSKCNL